jgi:AraC-like DNA-binding protein
VKIGRFRCPTDHPRFGDSGPTQNYCFVFPRTSVWIEPDGAPAFVADPNVVPFYNPAEPYRRRAISSRGDRTDWFAVGPELVRDAVAAYDPTAANSPSKLFRFDFGPATSATYIRQRALFEYATSPESPDTLLVEESVVRLLDEVLSCAYRHAPRLPARREHIDLVEDVRAYLGTTFARRLQLADVARAAGVSVFHLCRVFKAICGLTLHQYRSQQRIRRSLELLCDEADILTVAIALGYSDHSHFTAAFRRAFGLSPSQWRARSIRERARLAQRVDGLRMSSRSHEDDATGR